MRLFILMTICLTMMVYAPNVYAEDEPTQKTGPLEGIGASIDRGVDNAVENTKEFFSDSATTTRIKRRLFDDKKVSGLDVKITTRQEKVIVEGEAPTEKIASRIMEIVRSTEGVKQAENHLVIVTRKSSKAE